MNKYIMDRLVKRLSNKQTQFLIFSLSYYAILALIPTIFVSTIILKLFNVGIYLQYQNIFDSISTNIFANLSVFFVIIYMISRIFFLIFKDKYTIFKSLLLSIISSLLIVVFLSLFFTTYTLENNILSILLKLNLVFIFLFLLLYFVSNSNFKYSIIFSMTFSIISNVFVYLFSLAATFFINYEKYYGVLSPVFIIILALHFFIYIVLTAYIGAEEFTKISKMKFVKM